MRDFISDYQFVENYLNQNHNGKYKGKTSQNEPNYAPNWVGRQIDLHLKYFVFLFQLDHFFF